MNKRFQDKVVLVTGGSRGIGRAIALAFAQEGAIIVVNYFVHEGAANEVVEHINKVSQGVAFKCDVADHDQVEHMIQHAIETFGRIDILVNNAGVVFDEPFMHKPLEHWRRTIEVNLTGTYLCSKAAIPHMPDGGSIVNIASTNGIDTFHPDSTDYDASKAGTILFTKGLARELAPKIRVNAIAPGWIDTDINKGLPASYVRDETTKIALGRFGKPDEIARVATFLASEDASFITGSTIVVDGGYHS